MPGTWGANGRKKKCETWWEAGQRSIPARGPPEPEMSPCRCIKGCIHRNTRLRMSSRKVLVCSHLALHVNSAWPIPKVRYEWMEEDRIHFFFRFCCIPISLALNWLVCQMAKHLQLEWIRLIKERFSSKRWEVRHLLRSNSSEKGCLDFPGSVYGLCQNMLGQGNHPAGDHIIELILSINIDKNKRD